MSIMRGRATCIVRPARGPYARHPLPVARCVSHGSSQLPEPLRSPLRHRLAGKGHQGVGSEQGEGLVVGGRRGQGLREQAVTRILQLVVQRGTCNGQRRLLRAAPFYVVHCTWHASGGWHGGQDPPPQRRRHAAEPSFQPRLHSAQLVPWASAARTMSGVLARVSPSLAGSPKPPDAKCGRPPPLPPLTAAIRATRSPAFTPRATSSSVRLTCTPGRSPPVNITHTPFFFFSARNLSIISPTCSRSVTGASPTSNSMSPSGYRANPFPLSAPPSLNNCSICFSNRFFSSSSASMRRARCSGLVRSVSAASVSRRSSSSPAW